MTQARDRSANSASQPRAGFSLPALIRDIADNLLTLVVGDFGFNRISGGLCASESLLLGADRSGRRRYVHASAEVSPAHLLCQFRLGPLLPLFFPLSF